MSWTVLDVKSGQQSSPSAGNFALAAFAVNPQAGDLILVGCSNWNTTKRALLTPTDSAGGNTYTALGTQLDPSTSMAMWAWRCVVTNGGASFVITTHSTDTTAELTGIALLLRAAGTPTYNSDLKTATGTPSANPATGTTSPAPATDAFFEGFMANIAAQAVADGTNLSWNAIANGFDSTMLAACRMTDNATHQDLYAEYVLSNVAVDAQWTSTSDSWGALAFSYSSPTSSLTAAQEIPIFDAQLAGAMVGVVWK